MRNGFRKMQYVLLTLLAFAMAGCGANGINASNSTPGVAPGTVAAKLVLPKEVGKKYTTAFGTYSAGTASQVRLKVTGPTIPTAKDIFTKGADDATYSLNVYPGTNIIIAIELLDASGVTVYEGFATNQTVVANGTTSVSVQIARPVVKDANKPCLACHENTKDTDDQNLVANYKQSVHYTNEAATFAVPRGGNPKGYDVAAGCAGCHGNNHSDTNPGTSGRCAVCHTVGGVMANANHDDGGTGGYTGGANNTCNNCHKSHNTKGGGGCLGCHSIVQNAKGAGQDNTSYVNDNLGVRAVTEEFSKVSHHVTGRSVTNADCVACHMEGTGDGVVDAAYHMKDNMIHLRNGNTGLVGNQSAANGAEYLWDPSNPNHTAMDQFCLSCHNAAGAPSAALVTGNTATNPFGDSITNGYDQMSRGKVVAVFEQFDPANASHHAVRGAKYTARTSPLTGRAAVWAKYSSATNPGSRKTLYDAGMFVSTYTPLGATATVADNSTLHCGDCHTVGQFKPGSSVTALVDASNNPVKTTVVIGAHGSNNEYLLRNAAGTDALHHQDGNNGSVITAINSSFVVTAGGVQANGGNYVCYLCHNIKKYGRDMMHNGIDSGNNCNGNETVGAKGAQNVGYVAAALTAGGVAPTRVSAPSSAGGNAFGYSCANCHNAGPQGFGGIHGSNATFPVYSGTTVANANATTTDRKSYRFMGGLSLRYNGGNTPATGTWEQKLQNSNSKEGCYNLTTTSDVGMGNGAKRIWGTDASLNTIKSYTSGGTGTVTYAGVTYDANQNTGTVGSWGACGHHAGTSSSAAGTTVNGHTRPFTMDGIGRSVQRPLSY